MKNLVELMAKEVAWWSHSEDEIWEEDRRFAIKLLSVVKEHIGEVAQVCPRCNGSKYYQFQTNDIEDMINPPLVECDVCGCTGVIARTEGDV